ncbi:hypothetical protein DXU77_15570 [Pseudomonas lactis]|nr:hypothetical protein [Pseudomonas lactis]
MMLQSVQGIPLLWFIPVVALRHILMRPLGSLYKDRDSNPFLTAYRPLKASKNEAIPSLTWREAAPSGPVYALIMP